MVDENEINAMRRAQMAMAGLDFTSAAPLSESVVETTSDTVIAAPVPTSDPSIDAMKNIMLLFQNAGQTVGETLAEDARMSRPFRDALITEATPRGARVGAWEIQVHESGKSKSYDLLHSDTGDVIARDLRLYEAAQALTEALNDGESITGPTIRDILRIEEDYSRNLQDAIQFRHAGRIAESKGDMRKAAICEDRYGAARQRALTARAELRTRL
jgi:hypothetical protein